MVGVEGLAALRRRWLAEFEAPGADPVDVRRRVDGLYLLVAAWLAERLDERPPVERRRALCVGLQGPQGAGKSTLAARMVEALAALGGRAVTVSVDDFYLTHAEQRALAARHPGNRYLEHRGYPGTHDVALGAATLERLARLGAGERMCLPAYDKSAHAGRGDRLPAERSPSVEGPFDLVLLEGWMLGFPALDPQRIEDPDLRVANELLRAYDAWNRHLDAFVTLESSALEHIVTWRIDAERARRRAGRPALCDEEARDYILRFIPTYRLWSPALRAHPPTDGPRMSLRLGADRLPV